MKIDPSMEIITGITATTIEIIACVLSSFFEFILFSIIFFDLPKYVFKFLHTPQK